MVSMNRLKKQLKRLGILTEEVDKCKSIRSLTKLKAKFIKENGDSDGSNPEGQ